MATNIVVEMVREVISLLNFTDYKIIIIMVFKQCTSFDNYGFED